MISLPLNLSRWLVENEDKLQPPLNNYCLYSGKDYVITAAGGPNERNYFHVNKTEGWFYQHKGAMLLRVVDDEEFKDIIVEEGEMFLLPANTPHNPVRDADSIGIVIERARRHKVTDRLRWYCKNQNHVKPTVILEASFHISELRTELEPLLQNWIDFEDLRRCKECEIVADPKW